MSRRTMTWGKTYRTSSRYAVSSWHLYEAKDQRFLIHRRVFLVYHLVYWYRLLLPLLPLLPLLLLPWT